MTSMPVLQNGDVCRYRTHNGTQVVAKFVGRSTIDDGTAESCMYRFKQDTGRNITIKPAHIASLEVIA